MAPRKAKYRGKHDTERRRWAPRVARGEVSCARCGRPIVPGQAWDLDHVDGDPSRYLGVSHRRCNRSTSTHRARRAAAARGETFHAPGEIFEADGELWQWDEQFGPSRVSRRW
jgi:hypothetical protein